MGEIDALTEAQRRTLLVLADGLPHKGTRTGNGGSVLGVPAVELVRRGLATRTGASRTARPANPGYTYTITAEGLALLAGEEEPPNRHGWTRSSARLAHGQVAVALATLGDVSADEEPGSLRRTWIRIDLPDGRGLRVLVEPVGGWPQ